MNEWIPFASAIAVALIGGGAGWAAWRKASAESARENASAAREVVGGAGDLAKLLREQMSDMDNRVSRLEFLVGEWEDWADRVIILLSKAIDVDHPLRREYLRIVGSRPDHRSKEDLDE